MESQPEVTESNILKHLKEELAIAVKDFEDSLFEDPQYSKFCKIHGHLTNNPQDHNCIGCNLNDILMYTRNQLIQSLEGGNVQDIYFQIITSLYLAIERVDTILNIIELNSTYRSKHFKTIIKIRKWANFIKHPKAFIFCHHPTFTFSGYEFNSLIKPKSSVEINEPFILKYYSNDDKNEELYKKLQNQESVLVTFPNPKNILSGFANECLRFLNLIEKNEVYREILSDKTTFLNYYFNQKIN